MNRPTVFLLVVFLFACANSSDVLAPRVANPLVGARRTINWSGNDCIKVTYFGNTLPIVNNIPAGGAIAYTYDASTNLSQIVSCGMEPLPDFGEEECEDPETSWHSICQPIQSPMYGDPQFVPGIELSSGTGGYYGPSSGGESTSGCWWGAPGCLRDIYDSESEKLMVAFGRFKSTSQQSTSDTSFCGALQREAVSLVNARSIQIGRTSNWSNNLGPLDHHDGNTSTYGWYVHIDESYLARNSANPDTLQARRELAGVVLHEMIHKVFGASHPGNLKDPVTQEYTQSPYDKVHFHSESACIN